MRTRIRRDRGGSALRRLADRDAARTQGLHGARRRQGDVSERHDLDPPHPPPRRGGAASVGAAGPLWSRPAARPSTPTRSTSARSRSRASPGRRGAVAYAPRRTVLDKLLVDAASEAGAEVREEFTVESLVFEDGRVTGIRGHGKGGETVTERARVVVGADGRYSLVADAVDAEEYDEKPQLLVALLQLLERSADERPLRDVGPPAARLRRVADERRPDARHRRLAVLRSSRRTGTTSSATSRDARAGARIRRARSRGESRGALRRRGRAADISASRTGRAGRSSATRATTRTSSRRRASTTRSATPSSARPLSTRRSPAAPFEEAMDEYPVDRDGSVQAMYEFTADFATLEPPPPELQQLLAAVARKQEAMDGFARVIAGVTSPAEFFSDENVGRIFAAAA